MVLLFNEASGSEVLRTLETLVPLFPGKNKVNELRSLFFFYFDKRSKFIQIHEQYYCN